MQLRQRFKKLKMRLTYENMMRSAEFFNEKVSPRQRLSAAFERILKISM